MRPSKWVKNLSKYLLVLALMAAAAAIGIVTTKNSYQTTPEAGTQASTYLAPEEPGTPGVLLFPASPGTCFGPLVYTSLPPKCKTLEGKFIQLPGSYEVLVLPRK